MPVATEAVASDNDQMQGQSSNLLDGVYDEAANARSFQEALQEWRSGGQGPNGNQHVHRQRAPGAKHQVALGRSEGSNQTGSRGHQSRVKILMARPAGQQMRCSTPEHE